MAVDNDETIIVSLIRRLVKRAKDAEDAERHATVSNAKLRERIRKLEAGEEVPIPPSGAYQSGGSSYPDA